MKRLLAQLLEPAELGFARVVRLRHRRGAYCPSGTWLT
jgi:hypothetical protein